MEPSERDMHVLRLVMTFNQLDSTHLTEWVFADRSHSVPDKVLGRLVRTGYLTVIGRRTPGERGGATPFVYKLGRSGRTLLGVESRQSSQPNRHTLLIADSFRELRRAEKSGVLVVWHWEVERPVPPVRADLFVRVDYPAQRRTGNYFIEADQQTENPKRLREKIAGYWRAATTSDAEYFPYVVFVVTREVRKAEIERVIRRLPDEQRDMVRVFLLDELIGGLTRL